MKLRYIFFIMTSLIVFATAQAQVKVGDNPGTINGGSALEIESTNKGLLMPRVALTTTTTWGLAGTAVAGMSVYNTSAGLTSSNTTYPAAGVGEYYWDGTGWVSKKSGAQSGADNGLTVGYNSAGNVGLGGTLSKNTIIAQGANTLAFTSTATSGTSHFTVDGSTFNVNAVNNNVGIGTANPMGRLNVAQDNYTSSISTSYLTPGIVITGSTTENGFAGPGIYFEGKDNNVGQRVMKVNMTKLTSGVGFLNFQSVSDDGAVSGTNVMSVGINGRVGIGTIAPATKLEVNNGTTAGAIKIVDGTQGAGKVLISDANGVGTWQAPAGNVSAIYQSIGTNQVTIGAGVTTDIPGTEISFTTTNAQSTILITATAFGASVSAGTSSQGTLNIILDGNKVTSSYWSSGDFQSLVRIPIPTTVQQLNQVGPGSHTIKLQVKTWAGNALFNTDPIANNYLGAISSDANALKSRVSVVVLPQ